MTCTDLTCDILRWVALGCGIVALVSLTAMAVWLVWALWRS